MGWLCVSSHIVKYHEYQSGKKFEFGWDLDSRFFDKELGKVKMLLS